MILPHWQRASLLNRRNEINHKIKPNKRNRLTSSLRRTWILSPGYVCHPTHLYYKAWLVASCPGKKKMLPGGSGSLPVCHTRILLSHLCSNCPRHPRPSWSSVLFSPGHKILAKQAQFKSWSESFSETRSLTHVVVSFTEKWEKNTSEVSKKHTVSGRERKLKTTLPKICLLSCEDIILIKSSKIK